LALSASAVASSTFDSLGDEIDRPAEVNFLALRRRNFSTYSAVSHQIAITTSVGVNIDTISAERSGEVDRPRPGRIPGADRERLRMHFPSIVTHMC
jgi:hypothetical protein